MSKAEKIIDHFTDDAELKAKILKQVDAVRAGTMTLNDVIAEHTDDPAVVAKIKEIAGKVKAGHSMHAIAGYHHADTTKATSAAEAVLKHHGAVKHILDS